MSLIRKHVAVLQAWACLALVLQVSLGPTSLYVFLSTEIQFNGMLYMCIIIALACSWIDRALMAIRHLYSILLFLSPWLCLK